jgi:hypothetical protein
LTHELRTHELKHSLEKKKKKEIEKEGGCDFKNKFQTI